MNDDLMANGDCKWCGIPAASGNHYCARGGSPRSPEQPPPVPNDRPRVRDLVQADLDERYQEGLRRYGVPLQPHNGRDALRDAYEEILDAAFYIRQAIYERDGK